MFTFTFHSKPVLLRLVERFLNCFIGTIFWLFFYSIFIINKVKVITIRIRKVFSKGI